MLRALALLTCLTLTLSLESKSTNSSVSDKWHNAKRIENLQLYQATDSVSRAKGLMDRKNLGINEGLILVFDTPQRPRIWAMGTLTHLDVAFVDEYHKILAIGQLKARPELWQKNIVDDDRLWRQALRPDKPCLYVIEMPQGWFANHGIYPGDWVIWQEANPAHWLLHLSQKSISDSLPIK